METLKTYYESSLNWIGVDSAQATIVFKVFMVVFATLIAAMVAKRVLATIHEKLTHTKTVWDDAFIDAMRAPLVALIWLLGICYGAEILDGASEKIAFHDMVVMARKLGVVSLITWFAIRFVKEAENNLTTRREGRHIDKTTADAVGKLLKISILITAGLVILQTLGISISGVLAMGGVGGIVLGLAAKDLLSNFFGGLMVYMDRPFKVGDWVRSPDAKIEGIVEHIGWRLTRIRDFETIPLYVPNSVFTTVTLENPSRTKYRRINTTIGVRYDDFAKIDKIITDIREYILSHDDVADDAARRVHFTKYNDSSLDILVQCYAKTQDHTKFMDIQQTVLLGIGEIIEKHGAEIAYPTRTIHRFAEKES